MPITLDGTNGITTPMYNGSITANAVTPSVNMKNRIINGAMTIDQRNGGASSAFGTTGAYTTVDRYQTYNNTSGTATNQQVVDAPAGFYNSLKVTITASATPAAGELFQIQQIIEGYNIADFAFGTASARAITLSFWVKSSLTGQFGGAVQDGSAAYGYPFSYTISAANTWEQKSISITGATAGSWGATTSAGLRLYFDLGCGSSSLGTAGAWVASSARGATGDTKLISTNGATWFITGVQLEVGSTATSFDYRPYGTELQLCQRYYEQSGSGGIISCTGTNSISGGSTTANFLYGTLSFASPKRIAPTMTINGASGGSNVVSVPWFGTDLAAGSGNVWTTSLYGFNLWNQSGGTITTGNFSVFYIWKASAEL